jgi:heme-degrading monooxygenase HmoA
MFVNVGRFRFRPSPDGQQGMMQGIERDFAPLARACPGFRGVYLARPSDDEVMTVWLWDSQADWEAGLARFGPYLQQHVVPHLAGPPERVGVEVDVQIAP